MPSFNSVTGRLLNPIALKRSSEYSYLRDILVNPNPDASSPFGDNFGQTVAISNDYIVIGAYDEDDSGNSAVGRVYIYDATDGSLLRTLSSPNELNSSTDNQNQQFGRSVALSGNNLIVGAPLEDDDSGNSSVGRAYIFNVTTGALVHTLENPNQFGTVAFDQFGRAVAIDGNVAVVGAPFEDDGNFSSGTAYIFNVTTGSLTFTLANPTVGGNEFFGGQIDISGNYAIVSGENTDPDSQDCHIFDVTTGLVEYNLLPPGVIPGVSSFYPRKVAISADYAVVTDWEFGLPGRVFVYDLTDGSYLYTLNNPDNTGSGFGQRVCFGGNRLVVSTDNFVHLYELSDVGGILKTTVTHTSGKDGAFFGVSGGTAISDDYLVIGSPGSRNSGTNNGGEVYVFGK